MKGRRGRRRRKLLDGLKERREYFHLKEDALDRTKWRALFGRGFGPDYYMNNAVPNTFYIRCTVPHSTVSGKPVMYLTRVL